MDLGDMVQRWCSEWIVKIQSGDKGVWIFICTRLERYRMLNVYSPLGGW